MLNPEHILIPQVSWQRTLFEMLAEKGEYFLFKAASAIRRSLPDDFEDRFSEQDVVNFLIGATADVEEPRGGVRGVIPAKQKY